VYPFFRKFGRAPIRAADDGIARVNHRDTLTLIFDFVNAERGKALHFVLFIVADENDPVLVVKVAGEKIERGLGKILVEDIEHFLNGFRRQVLAR